MGRPIRVRVWTVRATLAFLTLTMAACSGGNPESVSAGTTGGSSPVGVVVAPTYVTIETKTGNALVGGEMQILQVGVRPPFRANLPRLENGMKRDFLLSTFRAADGTIFNRQIARARSVKVTAKDLAGKTYEFEAPFE